MTRIFCILLCVVGSTHPLLGQQIPEQLRFPVLEPDQFPRSAVETEVLIPSQPRRIETAFLLDRAVDRSQYILGPDDRLSIAIMGYTDAVYQVAVSAEGLVLVPKVGTVAVSGVTLEEAERRIRSRAQSVYLGADVDIALSAPRIFKVYLTGDVPDPGTKAASPLTRVSELVSNATRVQSTRQIRNILLIRSSGDTLSADLARFRQTGDLRFNPALREGDIVLVPALDETVQVNGRVFFPGIYEFRPQESLAELLSIANGYRGFPSNAHDRVEVSRFVGKSERELFPFTRAEAVGARGEEFILEPFDAIFVSSVSDYKVQKTATIEGEVLYPGMYPIRPDTTTVRDLIRMAGGLTPEASLFSARLVREDFEFEEEALRALERIPPEFLSEDELRVLKIRQSADPTNVVVDFAGLFARGREAEDVVLKQRDHLIIPEERDGVAVLGAVLAPGILSFHPDATIESYVLRAGGYMERADEDDAMVLKARLKTQLERNEVSSIDPGDTILVPFEKDKDWLEILRTTTTIATGVLSIILSYIAATR